MEVILFSNKRHYANFKDTSKLLIFSCAVHKFEHNKLIQIVQSLHSYTGELNNLTQLLQSSSIGIHSSKNLKDILSHILGFSKASPVIHINPYRALRLILGSIAWSHVRVPLEVSIIPQGISESAGPEVAILSPFLWQSFLPSLLGGLLTSPLMNVYLIKYFFPSHSYSYHHCPIIFYYSF